MAWSIGVPGHAPPRPMTAFDLLSWRENWACAWSRSAKPAAGPFLGPGVGSVGPGRLMDCGIQTRSRAWRHPAGGPSRRVPGDCGPHEVSHPAGRRGYGRIITLRPKKSWPWCIHCFPSSAVRVSAWQSKITTAFVPSVCGDRRAIGKSCGRDLSGYGELVRRVGRAGRGRGCAGPVGGQSPREGLLRSPRGPSDGFSLSKAGQPDKDN